MILIKNTQIVNEGTITTGDVLIDGERISKVGGNIDVKQKVTEIDGSNLHLFPGCIDDQVHFREPGLTHKADIYTESRAAVAGGVTSFMEMPNTVPNAITQELLENKYQIASQKSIANYSFFMGTSNDNIDEVLKTDPEKVCGIKIFMGSSTGNMLVDDGGILEQIFSSTPCLIATHCEDEATIKENLKSFQKKYGDHLEPMHHPLIRSAEACYKSSSFAVSLAKKHNTRLHILHISTAKETELFTNSIPLNEKRITAEACIHHLWFNDTYYKSKGNFIKWNPAIKSEADQQAIWEALLDNRIDVIATDHAPHTFDEKSQPYSKAPSGGPLVQHSLSAMIEFYHQGKISLEKIASKMAHDVATCFRIRDRGFIKEGYFADLVLVDLNSKFTVQKENLMYKCKWSPFEGTTFNSRIITTLVNGNVVFNNNKITDGIAGQRMTFNA